MRFFYWLYSVAINHVPLNWMLWKRSYNSAEKIKNNIMEWLEWEHVIEQKKKITNPYRSNGNGIISTNCDEQKLKWCYFTGICVSTFQSELHVIDRVLLQNKQNPSKHDLVTSLVNAMFYSVISIFVKCLILSSMRNTVDNCYWNNQYVNEKLEFVVNSITEYCNA